MLFSMLVSLYTSRVILQTLGESDYGIYNVVGGVVMMFSVISGSLSASISRFLTIELGKGDMDKLKKVFASSVTIQLLLSVVVFILAETIGLWFLNNRMVFPAERTIAANWIFQFSVINFVVSLINLPNSAVIIAREKMSVFAFFGVFDVLIKLLIAFLLVVSPMDKLIFYGLLLLSFSIVTNIVYVVYCKRNFEECIYKLRVERNLLKEMFGFAGWNFIGASSAVLRDHGGNIILNIFGGGTVVNAARGIAMQVCSIVSGFVSNFMVAVDPQITKSYASGEHGYMMKLVYSSAKYSFFILLIFAIPIFVNVDFILDIWLGEVPAHTDSFIRLVLLFTLSETLARPLITAMLATGKIRKYQIIVGSLQMLNLPISYLCLKHGCPPESVFVIAIFISVCCEMARLYMLRNMIGLSVKSFLSEVYIKVIVVLLLSAVFPYTLDKYVQDSWGSFFMISALSLFCTFLTIYFLGCNKEERLFLCAKVKNLKRIFPNDKYN